MIRIKQTKIKSLKKYSQLLQGKKLIIAIDLASNESIAQKIGFSANLGQGEKVLPAILGKISAFNAEGKEIVRRDLPKETHYNSIEAPNWGDPYYGTHTVNLPYEKYPRDFVDPPSVELKIANGKIVSPIFHFSNNESDILHVINLYLELFGECVLLNDKFEDFIKVPSKNLNWEVLPVGEMPWDRLHRSLNPLLKKLKFKDKAICEDRIQTLQSYSPDFTARGMAGFSGYIIFGFKRKGLYVCESIWHGNAIYVFEEDWKQLSQRTKAEILKAGLQKDRIVHADNWKDKLEDLLA